MTLKTDIKPISFLKNKTAHLVHEVTGSGRAVIITQHGEAKVVLIDFKEYERWKQAMALLKIIAQGEADVKAGRTVSHEESIASARAAIERKRRER